VKLRYLKEARQDVIEAAGWYETKYPGMGEQFQDVVEAAASSLLEHPTRWAHWPDTPSELNIRRLLLRQPKRKGWAWPYKIAYRVLPEEVVIVAVVHEKRRPNYWLDRVVLAGPR
jgi:plasmid stabilization system protein ParE